MRTLSGQNRFLTTPHQAHPHHLPVFRRQVAFFHVTALLFPSNLRTLTEQKLRLSHSVSLLVKSLLRLSARVPLEAWIWAFALLVLGVMNPGEGHASICLFRAVGLPWCPGCGLGRSVSHLLHGNIAASWQAHPLGAFAVAVLGGRVIVLLRQSLHSLTITHPSHGKEHPCPTSSRSCPILKARS